MEEETFTVEAQPRFATRPEPPAAGSEEEDRWARESTIVFDGGYIKSAYGNLVQTWNVGSLLDPCAAIDVNRKAYSVERTLSIGMGSKTVNYSAATYKRFPRRNSSSAAGGEIWTFVTDIGKYTARVSGDVQTVTQWICDNQNVQYGTLEVYTNRNAFYGTFGASLEAN